MDSTRKNGKLGGALLLLLFTAPLLALGWWQLQRAEQKAALLEQSRARNAQAPATLSQVLREGEAGETLNARSVRLRGRYDAKRQWYLDNRHYRSKVGIEVITPLEDRLSGYTVLVNRGWRPISPRRDLPAAPAPDGVFELRGQIHQPDGRAFVLRDDDYTPPWPRLIQSVDVAAMSEALGRPLFDYVVRLAPEQPGAAPADWRVVAITPERHIGYAVTWFALAATLALLALARARR